MLLALTSTLQLTRRLWVTSRLSRESVTTLQVGTMVKPKFRSLDSSSFSSSSFVLDVPAFSAAKRARLSRNYFVPPF